MKKLVFIASLVYCLLFMVVAVKPAQVFAAPADFIQAVGEDLVYRGQTILLQGTNFDNVPALGASIGSGNMSSIQITETDYQTLKANGGNHARLGLSFNWYQDNPTQFYAMLDQHIAWARAHDVWIVLNMFTTPADCYEGYSATCGIWTDPVEQQELEDFWVDMAQRYHDEPVIAGYGLLNEPNPQGPDYCSTWFDVASDIRDAVYAIAPNQLVFIAACADPGNSLRYRSPPFGTNIVYEVHDYTPIQLSTNSSLTYPGVATDWFGTCTYNKDAFLGIQQSGDTAGCGAHTSLSLVYGLDWGDTNNVPMYFGEWGATSSLNGYVQYHQDKAEIYTTLGVSTAHYTWKHRTIVTGGSNQWGIYSNPMNFDEPLKLAAVQTSWAGAVFPDFSVSTPSLSFTALSPNPQASTSPTWSGTGTGGSHPLVSIEYQLDGTGGSWTSCVATDGSFDEITEDFSCTPTGLTQGSHTIYFRASNTESMISSNETESFVIDTAAPGLTIPALSPNPTFDSTPAFTGTAVDAHGTVAAVEYQIGDTLGSWTSCPADDGTYDEASEAFTCTVSPALNPGTHTIYFRSRDQLGTNTSSPASQSFVMSGDQEWVQTDWVGGDGQLTWSDATRFFSSSQINETTAGEFKLSGVTITPWYNLDWDFRKPITIDHTKISGGADLSNFPVLINLSSDSDLAARALANGYDLVFTASDGTTKLSHEIEKYTTATGELQAWVKVPTVSATTDTQLYLYYGNPDASNQQSAAAVWTGNGFGGVWHLAQSPADSAPQFTDSLGVNPGTATSLVAGDQIACKIDGGIDFASSNDWISMPNGSALRPTGSMTVSAWIKVNSFSGNGRIFSKQGGSSARAYNLNIDSLDSSIAFGIATNASTMISVNSAAHPPTGTWVHVAGVYEPSTALRVYVDGVESGTNTTSIPATQFSNNGFGPRIGMSVNNSGDFNGQIDEVRLSNVVRTPGWIATEFANQNTPTSFYALGSQQIRDAFDSPGLLVSSIFDTQTASNWGETNFTVSTPTNTTATLKIRTSNSSSMAGATDFSLCPAISTATDVSATSCVNDTDRYAQYQVDLATADSFSSPIFSYFQLVYSPVNVVPSISLDATSSPTTSPVTITGTANDSDGLITNVEYQLDSEAGAWTSCDASDTSFNESSEVFSCVVTAEVGAHTVYVRATDNQSELSSTVSTTFTVQLASTPSSSPSTSTSSTPTTEVTAPSCNATTPGAKAPWLYAAVPQSATSVHLYLAPADGPLDHYVLRFGTKSGEYSFGSDNITGVDRVLNVSHLQPNTTYFFSLRAGNQCAVGPWSNEIQVKTLGVNGSILTNLTSTFLPDLPASAPTTEAVSSSPNLELLPDTSTNSNSTLTGADTKNEGIAQDESAEPGKGGHAVNIQVKDAEDEPVVGAKVVIHSEPMESTTNDQGKVAFSGVEPGQHTLFITYGDTKAEQSIYISEETKNLNLVVKLEPLNRNREYLMAGAIVGLLILSAGLYWKRK